MISLLPEYDFAIVGAGPAGSTLARLLAPRYRVLLLERRKFEHPSVSASSEKCCSGLLSPDAQKVLAQFSLALPEDILDGPQLFAVHARDLQSGRSRLYQRFYLNMNRGAFDRWLASLAVEASASLVSGASFLRYDPIENFCTFRGPDSVLHHVKCHALIAADGTAGRVRHIFGNRVPSFDRYVAVQEEYEGNGGLHHFSAFFDSALTDYYGWMIPKRSTMLMGCAFPVSRNVPVLYGRLKQKLEEVGLPFGRLVARSGSMLLRPRLPGSFWFGCGRVFAVGEAAGLISPSSAEGFSYAMRSAQILADVLLDNPHASVSAYGVRMLPLVLNLTGKTLKSPWIYQSFLRNAVFYTGIGSI